MSKFSPTDDKQRLKKVRLTDAAQKVNTKIEDGDSEGALEDIARIFAELG